MRESLLPIINHSFLAGVRLGDRSGRSGGTNRRIDGGDCHKQSLESVRLRVQPRPYTWHSRHRRSLLRTHYSRWDLRAHGTCPNITPSPNIKWQIVSFAEQIKRAHRSLLFRRRGGAQLIQHEYVCTAFRIVPFARYRYRGKNFLFVLYTMFNCNLITIKKNVLNSSFLILFLISSRCLQNLQSCNFYYKSFLYFLYITKLKKKKCKNTKASYSIINGVKDSMSI